VWNVREEQLTIRYVDVPVPPDREQQDPSVCLVLANRVDQRESQLELHVLLVEVIAETDKTSYVGTVSRSR
jgi:hypothetical protein